MTYGCHNREPLRLLVTVQHGWAEDATRGHLSRRPVMTTISDPMTKTCQYTLTDLGQRDPKCLGCKHRLGGV